MGTTREAIQDLGRRMADAERRAGRLPDSKAIERTAAESFRSVAKSIKPGKAHPIQRERDGERK